MLNSLTHQYRQEILIEEYLPEINSGEVRLWFSNGHFIGALKKFPLNGDFRVLIDEGSKIIAHQPDAELFKIIHDISASLKKQSIVFAAVDLIGNKICDYNFTSPGLLVQLEKVHGGRNFAKEVLEAALEYRVQKVHG